MISALNIAKNGKQWLPTLLPFALIAAPAVIEALYISRYAVDVPFWDEWVFVPLLQTSRQSGNWLLHLWAPLNEHRMVFPRLLFLVLSSISGWNVIVEMYFSLFLACLLLLGLGLIYKEVCHGSLWGFVPIAWLVFSLGQYENILYGMQMAFYLNVLAMLWTFYFLSVRPRRMIGWAMLSGIVASFSLNSGLLVWPVGLLYLIIVQVGKRQLATWGLVGLLVIVAYYTGYDFPPNHSSPLLVLSQPIVATAFLIANVGSPLGGTNLGFSLVMGAYLMALLLLFAYKKLPILRHGIWRQDPSAVLVNLVLMSVLSSIAITIGRVGLGFEAALSSRYTTITSMGIIGIYMLFAQDHLSGFKLDGRLHCASVILCTLFPVIVIGLIMANAHGIDLGAKIYETRLRMKYVLQTFDIQSDDALKTLYLPGSVRGRAPYLQQEKLSVFREPVGTLLPPSYEEGMPVGDILPHHAVVQAFRCPVPTLKDISVLLATYNRHNTSSFQISLIDNNTILVQQSFLAAEIKDNSWLHLMLPTPVENCAGQDLVLRIKSRDASPGNAITIWTYPRYYDGKLLKPADPSFSDRVIGLELNTRGVLGW